MMQLNFWEVLSNLVGLFLLIAVGYMAVRLNILPASASGVLSKLLLKITLPCTIFTSLLRPYDPAFLKDILIVVALGLVLFPVNALLSNLGARLLRVPEGRRGVWSFCATFCNNGFMGFPIALALFGEEGLALAAVFGLPFNLLVYSVGVNMVCTDRPAQNGEKQKVKWTSVLLTSVNVSALVGLVFYFAQLSVPTAVLTPITHLANVTTPLSMFVTGMNLTGGKFSQLFRDRDILSSSVSRLVVLPLISFAILTALNHLFPFGNPLILGVVFIIMSMPAPAVATILAENYGVNREFAAGIVFLSSLFCIVTIPLMALLV